MPSLIFPILFIGVVVAVRSEASSAPTSQAPQLTSRSKSLIRLEPDISANRDDVAFHSTDSISRLVLNATVPHDNVQRTESRAQLR